MKVCKQYKQLLNKILNEGVLRNDPNRKGIKRIQIPFTTMSIDLREGFPILTTKKMWWKGIVAETLWLLKGNSNIKELVDQEVNIWNKDAYNYFLKTTRNRFKMPKIIWKNQIGNPIGDTKLIAGGIGRMYGVQWRNWRKFGNSDIHYDFLYKPKIVDQLKNAINTIKNNPLSSNIRIFGDNPADADEQALPCCMDYMQFSCEKWEVHTDHAPNGVEEGYYLDLTIHYRSWDVLLGAPWNIAQYALILSIIAKITNKVPRHLNIVANNVHLYDNQIQAAKEQVKRGSYKYDLPKLKFSTYWDGLIIMKEKNEDTSVRLLNLIEGSLWTDYKLEKYQSYPKLENQPEMNAYAK
jgi:thymidylate synthase